MFGLAFIISLITLVISVPIFLVFGLGSSLAAIAGLNLPWSVLIQVSFGALTKHVLIAVPLFIFTGMAMLKGGAASKISKFTTTLVGHWPGGLGVAMVIAMGFFAAFCGSILAAITAVGTIMMPKMIEHSVSSSNCFPLNSWLSNSICCSLSSFCCFLEALIPPSNAAILFSALTNVPVSKTFAAGVIPGLVLLVLMVLLVLFKCRHIRTDEKASFKERASSFIAALPALITPVIILGGIYAGILTPSESAAVAGVYAVLIGFLIYHELTFSSLMSCLRETAIITAVIFAIIATATFLSVVLTYTQAPQKIITFFTDKGVSVNLFWIMLGAICLILGTFIEIVPVFYLTVNNFCSNHIIIQKSKVFSSSLCGVCCNLNKLGIGMITPPYALVFIQLQV